MISELILSSPKVVVVVDNSEVIFSFTEMGEIIAGLETSSLYFKNIESDSDSSCRKNFIAFSTYAKCLKVSTDKLIFL
jgi:hypothetical protein